MGQLVRQLLLESLGAPFLIVGLIMAAVRVFDAHKVDQGRLTAFVQAFAIMLGICATYVLAFGWPPSLTGGARTKIILSAVIGLAIGLAVEWRVRWARFGLAAGAIGIPLAVGIPALQLGKPESALLILPIAATLSIPSLIGRGALPGRRPWLPILLTLAVGLAAIAALAKALSFAELGLSLGSALFAVLAISRAPLALPAATLAAAMLLALLTALLLYSEASTLALLVLVAAIGAERLARWSSGTAEMEAPALRVLFFCFLPALAAIVIARIDAGPISIY